MKATFLKGVVLGSVVSVVMLTATAAFAGSGVGAVLNLGKYNGVNSTTALAGSTNGNQLNVTNIGNQSASAGIGITVHSGKPPLVVNSSTQVKNLNASYLGGMKASQFVVPRTALVASNGTLIRGSRVTGVSQLDVGRYQVDFDRDVSTCAYSVTPYLPGVVVYTEPRAGLAHSVFVATMNPSGSAVSADFYLIVIC